MKTFDFHLKEAQASLNPELFPLIEKVKTATGLLKKHMNHADRDEFGALVEYADWCFYPEQDGTITTLVIYADMVPVRLNSQQKAQDSFSMT